MKKKLLFILTLLCLTVQGAMADGYVTDIMTISGGSSSITNQYTEQGWRKAGGDLNSGAGGDYVYLLYKMSNDNGSSGTPVTDVYLMIKESSTHNQTLKQGGRTYQLVTGGHDLNKGAGGDFIYLYYTKEPFANGRKVTKLLVDENEEGAEGKNGNNNPADLNSGVSTGTRPYLHVTATQDRGFITDVMLISGGENTIANLRNTYLEQGWWVNYQDLNEDAGGPFINLLFKTDNETGSSNYITDFYIKKGSGHPNSLTHDGRTYYLTPGGGNDDFNGSGCDLNHGVGGDYLYLYYTRDAFSPARAINSIRFRPVRSESASVIDNAKKGSLGANGEGEGCDLNSKAYHNDITMNCKIFMLINIVPLATTPQVVWCESQKTLYFISSRTLYAAGDNYEGYDVTDAWNGSDVTNTGANTPSWNYDAVRNTCTKVVFDESFAEARPKSLYQWFSLMTKLEEIDGIQNLNTSEVTNMGLTFLSCISLQSLDLSGFDVSQVSNTTAMFNGCSSLSTIYSDNIWNIAASEKMFYGCYNLVGAASFSSSKDGGEMANPVTGYFTSRTTLADNMDNTSVLAERNQYYGHVTLEGRTLTKDGTWNTLCLPFSLDSFAGTPLEGATVKTLASATFEDGTLTLNFSDDLTAIEAGKPYIVKWEAQTPDHVENPTFEGVTISNSNNPVETEAVSFLGLYAPYTIGSAYKGMLYLDTDNKLCWPTGEMTINALRAYFQLASAFDDSGDVNGDGEINVTDVTMMVDYILGKENAGFIIGKADVNGDGGVDITDVTALVNIILDSNNVVLNNVVVTGADGITFGGN